MPNIDGNFLKYGVTTDDLKVIEGLCEEKEVSYDMVLNILEQYQKKKNNEETITDSAFERIVNRETN